MKNLTLYNIANACGGKLVLTERAKRDGVTGQTEITGAVIDSRKLQAGNLFFATVGERVDGHSFISSVFEKGAYCAVTQKTPEEAALDCPQGNRKSSEALFLGSGRGDVQADPGEGSAEDSVNLPEWGAYILVKDSFQALKDIAEFYRSTLTIPVVGITGSVGKTSTKEFVAGVLAQKYRVFKTEGNYNNEVGVPLMLLSIREEHEIAVLEMGISDFGEMHRLSKMVRPDCCVITNIGQCHLENLKTRDGILKAKTEIFDYMAPDGEVCLNGEDDKLATVARVHGKPVHFFGMGKNPAEEVYASDVEGKGLFGSLAILHSRKENADERLQDPAGTDLTDRNSVGTKEAAEGIFEAEEETFPIKVPLPGAHMVVNAAAAACVGQLFHLSKEQIAEGISRVEPVGGRSHLIPLGDYTLIDDCYNANPVSMRAAIDLLNMADTEKAAILGDMFELGKDSDRMHYSTGAYAGEAGLQALICIGENARFIYQGAREKNPETKLYYFKTKEDFLKEFSEKGEKLIPRFCTVLIKASHGMGFSELVERFQKQ